jgi:hypothetical protein
MQILLCDFSGYNTSPKDQLDTIFYDGRKDKKNKNISRQMSRRKSISVRWRHLSSEKSIGIQLRLDCGQAKMRKKVKLVSRSKFRLQNWRCPWYCQHHTRYFNFCDLFTTSNMVTLGKVHARLMRAHTPTVAVRTEAALLLVVRRVSNFKTRVRTSLKSVFKLIRTSHDSSQSPKFRKMTRQNPESDSC